ncbi:NTP transferase domain-containing protein [Sphingomonas sp. MMS12-HWE2-04]|uniref:phosphocholine cytidylyltransferase family protein n=1 Tax=Sphingomonas sp. MMS12-HWE2-04 TaxID=3234199 RepID=UPI00384FB275
MITTAILLAAGEGSRLRAAAPFKPLCTVAGRALLGHALHGLAQAGLTRAIVVLGYGAEQIEAYLAGQAWPLKVETVRTGDYKRPNGVSLLAAEPLVAGEDALLAMCDHLVDPALYRRVALAGAGGGARLAIDRRVESDWVDLDDVTCVESEGDRIIGIGKGLAVYDCFDTGVFAISAALFAALHGLDNPSLTEGMRVLAGAGTARIVECSDLDWIDVDDAPALEKAERWKAAAPLAQAS